MASRERSDPKSGEALDGVVIAAEDRSFVRTGLRTFETEASRYFDEVAAHSRATIEALGKCESPFDVLAVEQAWVKARSEAYLDSGLRFAEAFASVAQSLSSSNEADEPRGIDLDQ